MVMLKTTKTGAKLTPEAVQSKLFYLHDAAHKYHLDTKSFAQHEALDTMYKSLVDFKDEISEKLQGYMGGDRIGELTLQKIPAYTESAPMKLANEIMDFGKELEEWAEDLGYCDIENIAQGLSGLGAKSCFLLTLK